MHKRVDHNLKLPRVSMLQLLTEGKVTVRKPLKRRCFRVEGNVRDGFTAFYQSAKTGEVSATIPVNRTPLGEIYYVRETWALNPDPDGPPVLYYVDDPMVAANWITPVQMPKEYSRFYVRLVDIRVESRPGVLGGFWLYDYELTDWDEDE